MSAIDQFMDKQSRDENAAITQQIHDNSWEQTFHNTPPADVLRQNRNIVDMVSQATQRKMAIMAQTDAAASDLYQKNATFNEWQKQADMRDSLLRGQVAHQAAITQSTGAAEAYKMKRELDIAHDSAGFHKRMADAESPTPGDPGYDTFIHQGYVDFPNAAFNPIIKRDTIDGMRAHTKLLGFKSESEKLAEKLQPQLIKAQAEAAGLLAAKESLYNKMGKEKWDASPDSPKINASVIKADTRVAALQKAINPNAAAGSADTKAPPAAPDSSATPAPSATPSATPANKKPLADIFGKK